MYRSEATENKTKPANLMYYYIQTLAIEYTGMGGSWAAHSTQS